MAKKLSKGKRANLLRLIRNAAEQEQANHRLAIYLMETNRQLDYKTARANITRELNRRRSPYDAAYLSAG